MSQFILNLDREAQFVGASSMSEQPVPLMLNTLLRPFISELDRLGIPYAQLLERCGMKSQNFLLNEHYVTVRSSYKFVEECAEATNDKHFGFNLGSKAPLQSLANFELVDLSRSSLGDLLSALILDARRVNSSATYTITNDGEWVQVVGKRVFRPGKPPAQVDAFFAAYMRNAIRIYAGQRWSPELLTIWVCDPSVLPISQLNNTVVIKGDRMGARFRFPSTWMVQKAEEIIQRLDRTRREEREQFIADFRTLLSGQLGNQSLTMNTVAKDLSISPSTLRRELKRNDTSYSLVLTNMRLERAEHLLKESGISIAEIGKLVGFENPSSFARAFRSKSGQTPKEFRALNASER
ncbi:AraC family transcriptional regulator [Shimia abyssi]|uniref:AraC-like DNA-binding protein n=1 Tax=Shimia abyssi TaxID=1662395 RepID=A0A2P8F6F5_9RHOB|nr:AraC family transcriptional regulator [Shimia abyssi]PSL17285.1 AraC-like DNA-binding protein [Shimia abyssi]